MTAPGHGLRALTLVVLVTMAVFAGGVGASGAQSAGNAAGNAPATFAVSVDGTNDPVDEGETLAVDVTVENTGDATGTRTIELSTGSVVRDSVDVELAAGATVSTTLEWGTGPGDAGDYAATVASPDDAATTDVTVRPPATPAEPVDLNASDLPGSGLPDDPYVVTNASELQAMASDLDAHYVLGEDVDASETAGWHDGAGFEPIGDVRGRFVGSFDGNGSAIVGLTVGGLATDRSDDAGLFAYVGEAGRVESVTVTNASVAGDRQVGVLAGELGGTIANVSVTGTVEAVERGGGLVGASYGGEIRDVRAEVDVTVAGEEAGGLVGYQTHAQNPARDALVRNATATGNVTGTDSVGGLVGENWDPVTDGSSAVEASGATGDVTGVDMVGGLVGENHDGTVADSYATGSVNGSDAVGGLIGEHDGILTRSYATGAVTGSDAVGGLIGDTGAGTVAASYATGAVDGNATVGGLIGYADSSTDVTAVYATGSVTGTAAVGGLVGDSYDDTASVEHGYWNVETSGQDASAGGTGLSADGMTGERSLETMRGFEFDGPWVATDGSPRLVPQVEAMAFDLAETDLAFGDETTAVVELRFADGTTASASAGPAYDVADESVLRGDRGTFGAVNTDGTATTTVTATVGDVSGQVAVTVTAGASGTVEGTVRDATTGEPVENATVTVWYRETTTDDDGTYAVEAPPGDLATSASASGYATARGSVDVTVGETATADLAVQYLGAGTPEDPYRVFDARTLQSMQQDLDAHYVLVRDVDASETAQWNGSRGFAPVGDWTTPFTGRLDGNGHAIANLTVDRPRDNDVGLFGVSGGTVSDLVLCAVAVNGDDYDVGGLVGANDGGTVANVSVSGRVTANDGSWATGGVAGANYGGGVVRDSSSSVAVAGDQGVGGVVGENWESTVRNASASGPVDGGGYVVGGLVGANYAGSVTNSSATGTVAGSAAPGSGSVGGLVGENTGNVTGTYATGTVEGRDNVGGLVGWSSGTVVESYATGSVEGNGSVGGLVGANAGTVSETYAAGGVSGEGDAVGGLIGQNGEDGRDGFRIENGSDGTVTGSYWNVDATGQVDAVGQAGGDDDGPAEGGDSVVGGDVRGLTSAEMTGTSAVGNMTAFDFDDTWATADAPPLLRWSIDAVELSVGDATLPRDETTHATVTFELVHGERVSATTVATVASGDTSVATVEAGTVAGIALGNATITAAHTGASDAVTVAVVDETAPTADAGGNRTVEAGSTASFDGSNSTDDVGVDTYAWNFGDDTNVTGETVTHSFSDPGEYVVTLTVTDAAGNRDTETVTVTVERTDTPEATPPGSSSTPEHTPTDSSTPPGTATGTPSSTTASTPATATRTPTSTVVTEMATATRTAPRTAPGTRTATVSSTRSTADGTDAGEITAARAEASTPRGTDPAAADQPSDGSSDPGPWGSVFPLVVGGGVLVAALTTGALWYRRG